ncbi:MAG: regulatory protein RecX [Deltaproteobacteria bacterium]|nr:MAG: regulatory protein RecX [Deltaproteobacteria bacterium]
MKKKGGSEESALSRALSILSRRDYSEAEVREKLLSRGYPEEEVASTISRLKELGYIDDRRLALFSARYRLENLGQGRRKVWEYLTRRRIPREIIEEVLDEACREVDVVERGVALLERRHARRPFDILEEKGKIFRYLAGRGYTPEEVRKIIERFEEKERGSR